MDSHQSMHFRQLCKTLNITKAAEECFITRQAFSTSIAKLEREVGAPLFKRGKSGVTITEAGSILLRYLESQEAQWNETLVLIGRTQRRSVLRVGLPPIHLPARTLRRVVGFENEVDGCTVQIVQSEEYNMLLRKLVQGEIDVCFGLLNWGFNEGLTWVEEETVSRLCLLMGTGHRLAANDTIDFSKDLHGETLYCVSHETVERLQRAHPKSGADFTYIEPNITFLLEKVATGNGLFLVPENLAETLENPELTYRLCKPDPIKVSSGLACRNDADPLVRRFIEYYLNSKD